MSQNKTRVLPKPSNTKKKPRPALHKLKILEKIKLSSYKPNQKLINSTMNTKQMLDTWDSDKSSNPVLRVV